MLILLRLSQINEDRNNQSAISIRPLYFVRLLSGFGLVKVGILGQLLLMQNRKLFLTGLWHNSDNESMLHALFVLLCPRGKQIRISAALRNINFRFYKYAWSFEFWSVSTLAFWLWLKMIKEEICTVCRVRFIWRVLYLSYPAVCIFVAFFWHRKITSSFLQSTD